MAGDLQVTLVKMQKGAPPPADEFIWIPTDLARFFHLTQHLLCLGGEYVKKWTLKDDCKNFQRL